MKNKHYSNHHNNNNNWKKNSDSYDNFYQNGNNRSFNGKNNNHSNNHNNHSYQNNFKNRGGQDFKIPQKFFHPTNAVSDEQIKSEDEAIKKFKASSQKVCCKCGQVIQDLTQAISGKTENSLMHFDCALEEVSKSESLGPGDKIAYIGQGRFGLLHFENPHDMKHFQIRKIIEWENKEEKAPFRNEMADLYSLVK